MMSILALLISIVIWGVIFYILWWGLGKVGITEPFNKVAVVVLVVAAVVIAIGLLTGSVPPFYFLTGLTR